MGRDGGERCVVAAAEMTHARRSSHGGMVQMPMIPQHGRIVLIALQDGRQLEGSLIVLTDRFEVDGTAFEPWERLTNSKISTDAAYRVDRSLLIATRVAQKTK
jgi:hypothetical protein